MRSVLALVLLACAACSATPADDASSSATNAVSLTPDLAADIKAAYEAANAPGNASILKDVQDIDWADLTGDAREAYNEYANTSSWGLIAEVGGPIAQAGTFEGNKIYFIAGDLSDTGSEWGFYDEKGNALAVAYGGQGEHPGPGGVDWEK